MGNITGSCLLVQQASLIKLCVCADCWAKLHFAAMAQHCSSICKAALSEHQVPLMGCLAWCEKCILAFPSSDLSCSVSVSLPMWMMFTLALFCGLSLLSCLGILQWHLQDICKLKLETELFPCWCFLSLLTLHLGKEKGLNASFSAHVQAELLASPVMVLGA